MPCLVSVTARDEEGTMKSTLEIDSYNGLNIKLRVYIFFLVLLWCYVRLSYVSELRLGLGL